MLFPSKCSTLQTSYIESLKGHFIEFVLNDESKKPNFSLCLSSKTDVRRLPIHSQTSLVDKQFAWLLLLLLLLYASSCQARNYNGAER